MFGDASGKYPQADGVDLAVDLRGAAVLASGENQSAPRHITASAATKLPTGGMSRSPLAFKLKARKWTAACWPVYGQ